MGVPAHLNDARRNTLQKAMETMLAARAVLANAQANAVQARTRTEAASLQPWPRNAQATPMQPSGPMEHAACTQPPGVRSCAVSSVNVITFPAKPCSGLPIGPLRFRNKQYECRGLLLMCDLAPHCRHVHESIWKIDGRGWHVQAGCHKRWQLETDMQSLVPVVP